MTAHEIVIRLGRPFDVQGDSGQFLAGVREIRIPFADRESAEAVPPDCPHTATPQIDRDDLDMCPCGHRHVKIAVWGSGIRQAAEIEEGA